MEFQVNNFLFTNIKIQSEYQLFFDYNLVFFFRDLEAKNANFKDDVKIIFGGNIS